MDGSGPQIAVPASAGTSCCGRSPRLRIARGYPSLATPAGPTAVNIASRAASVSSPSGIGAWNSGSSRSPRADGSGTASMTRPHTLDHPGQHRSSPADRSRQAQTDLPCTCRSVSMCAWPTWPHRVRVPVGQDWASCLKSRRGEPRRVRGRFPCRPCRGHRDLLSDPSTRLRGKLVVILITSHSHRV